MLKYTQDHEWLDTSDAEMAVGITAHAVEQLGDIVYIELPEVDSEVTKGDEIVVIDSSKAASGISAPVDGVITAVNSEIAEHPELVNEDPAGQWFFRIRPTNPDDLEGLLDEDAYQALIG
jgi:glycine cleavage system H protein